LMWVPSLSTCGMCGKTVGVRRKYCSRDCYANASRLGLIPNSGQFKPGSTSPNKGRTLESWVGEERAREIKARMSINSVGKAKQLRRLNQDPGILQKRMESRHYHDLVVEWVAGDLRRRGHRVYVLSEYVREPRVPDAIVFDGKNLIAVEVETDKRWKPSHPSTEDKLTRLNSKCGFFDKTKVVFPRVGAPLREIGPGFVAHILA